MVVGIGIVEVLERGEAAGEFADEGGGDEVGGGGEGGGCEEEGAEGGG